MQNATSVEHIVADDWLVVTCLAGVIESVLGSLGYQQLTP